MELGTFTKTSLRLWRGLAAYVTKTPERKYTAAGIGLGFGMALIFVPPLGIVAFGAAITGWGIVVAIVTLFGGMVGNRWGVELERRRAKKP
ncbi:hypothetical protein EJC49_04675 [Aquibium carbonis]|uniref:Uncharacterized protein n=1 Tax=Aquibium carbonis TaxID=2495581 RepID=A0A3R9YBJ3_9HYPH|nr:hypothetical protein [Aquibium carbonis]RST87522.1 hypothetical protein EJC49_04675 [Aquibium carbonis]